MNGNKFKMMLMAGMMAPVAMLILKKFGANLNKQAIKYKKSNQTKVDRARARMEHFARIGDHRRESKWFWAMQTAEKQESRTYKFGDSEWQRKQRRRYWRRTMYS